MAVIGIQTLLQQAAKIRRRILANNGSQFSTVPGSVVGDLFVIPQAISDVQQNAISYLVAISMSIPDILALQKDANTLGLIATALNSTEADVITQLSGFIDNWGENFSETRRPPAAATGTVKWGRPTPPTADITVGVGKIVKTSGGVEYKTTASATMVAASAGSYYDSNLGYYVLEIPVEASDAGASGNAPAGAISLIGTAVSGMSVVTNTSPVSGGADLESDDDYGARLLAKWQAVGKLTQAGVADSVMSVIAGVLDVYVAKTGDALSLRGAGKTDLWFKGEAVTEVTETFNAFNDPSFPNAIRLTYSPAISLVSIDSGAAVLRPDSSTALAGSVQSVDRVQFTSPPVFPVKVVYTYDAQVAAVQNVFNVDANAPLNQEDPVDALTANRTPILAKRAKPIDVDYALTVVVQPGQNATVVKAAVAVNLATFSNDTKLGDQQFLSDLNQIVEETPGILRITHVQLFALAGQSGVEDSISVEANEYVRLRNVTLL